MEVATEWRNEEYDDPFVEYDFEAMSDDQLVAMIDGFRGIAKRTKERLSKAEGTMLMRLEGRNATVFDGTAYECKFKAGNARYEYLFDVLEGLKSLVRPELFNATFEPSYKVDKRQLNELHKQGGEIAEIINAGVIVTPGLPTLEIMPKAQD